MFTTEHDLLTTRQPPDTRRPRVTQEAEPELTLSDEQIEFAEHVAMAAAWDLEPHALTMASYKHVSIRVAAPKRRAPGFGVGFQKISFIYRWNPCDCYNRQSSHSTPGVHLQFQPPPYTMGYALSLL